MLPVPVKSACVTEACAKSAEDSTVIGTKKVKRVIVEAVEGSEVTRLMFSRSLYLPLRSDKACVVKARARRIRAMVVGSFYMVSVDIVGLRATLGVGLCTVVEKPLANSLPGILNYSAMVMLHI